MDLKTAQHEHAVKLSGISCKLVFPVGIQATGLVYDDPRSL